MRKFLLIFVLLLAGCGDDKPAPESPNADLFRGTHLLRQIQPTTHSSISGSYFLFAGGFSGQTETKVTFAWKGNDNAYRFTTLPLEKVHIVIDDSCVIPYVRFRWRRYPNGDDAIFYVVLGVNSRDWPESIHVPLQAGQ